jgi:hypothetical protein
MQRIPLQRAEQRALVHGAAAVLSHAQGRFTESESEFRSALVEWERAGKSSGAEVASLLDGLASLYISEERLDEAARVLDGALAALTTAPDTLPMDRIRLLQVRAALDQRKGNWCQAERNLEQALALAGAELRPDADLQVSMMTDYARLLRNHHQRREAHLVEQQVAALRSIRQWTTLWTSRNCGGNLSSIASEDNRRHRRIAGILIQSCAKKCFDLVRSIGRTCRLIPAQVHHRRPLRKRRDNTFPVAHAALHSRIERNPIKDRTNPKLHQQHREKRPVFFECPAG